MTTKRYVKRAPARAAVPVASAAQKADATPVVVVTVPEPAPTPAAAAPGPAPPPQSGPAPTTTPATLTHAELLALKDAGVQPPAATTPAQAAAHTRRVTATGQEVMRKRKPVENQATLAIGAATDLESAAAHGDYARFFVSLGPADAMAARLRNAAESSSVAKSAEDAALQARTRKLDAWDGVLRGDVDPLNALFAVAITTDPGLETRYPSLTAFLNARSRVATRAAATRRANTRQKQQAGG